MDEGTSAAATPPRAYTVRDAAELLSISDRHARQLIADGVLRVVRIGPRRLRIPEAEVRRFLEEGLRVRDDP